MAAGTEGFNDTSQPGRDHLGAMISKVIAARKFAREEREQAEAKAKKAGYDSCLLYTSPSPRDGLLSRMPSSA